MRTWKLEDVKNRFSKLVRWMLALGPQRVARHGRDAVVVLSAAEYERLAAPQALVDFLRASPLAQALAAGELQPQRENDLGRDLPI